MNDIAKKSDAKPHRENVRAVGFATKRNLPQSMGQSEDASSTDARLTMHGNNGRQNDRRRNVGGEVTSQSRFDKSDEVSEQKRVGQSAIFPVSKMDLNESMDIIATTSLGEGNFDVSYSNVFKLFKQTWKMTGLGKHVLFGLG